MQILSLVRAGGIATVVYADASGIRQTTLPASLTDAEIATILTPEIPPSPLFGGPSPAPAPAKKRSRR